MPYPNEHSARILDPDAEHDEVRSMEMAPGIRAILYITGGKSKVQALRFDKDRFTPEAAKRWCADHGYKPISFEPAAEAATNKAHDTILQTLDRWFFPSPNERVFIPRSEFEPTLDAWQGTPLIYGKDHPEPKAFALDPEAELARVKARRVGKLIDPRIVTEGHSRFMATMDWGDDAELEEKWAAGRLSPSTAFFMGGMKDGVVKGPIVPNHILLFEDDGKANRPGDPGVFILNKGETITAGEGAGLEEGLGLIDRLKAWAAKLTTSPGGPGGAQGETEMADKETEQKLASMSEELTVLKNKLASRDVEAKDLGLSVTAKDAEIATLQGELKAFKTKAADERWAVMKAKCPPGMVHGEKEAEARKLYESDKDAFYGTLLGHKAEGTRQEGATFTAGKGAKDEATVDAELKKYATEVVVEER